ncbi:MAG: hypothetical protein RBS08_08950 [Bdellovibrionales bacterium]|jgi:hypothetical protein|nr:hypothetical protein [Bdellovibrionales bacterium]
MIDSDSSDQEFMYGDGFAMGAPVLPTYVREELAQATRAMAEGRKQYESTVQQTALRGSKFIKQEQPGAPRGGFEYGWCYTDHKTGKTIREDFRKTDYLKDEPYAARVHAMLEQLGLPMPEEGEIFRGTRHDLLFLNSHGVVLRIGPQDVQDLINPGFLQPIGWIEDRQSPLKVPGAGDLPLTVAIYPGIEVDASAETDERYHSPSMKSLYEVLVETKQDMGDVTTTGNTGFIHVLDDDGAEVPVRVVVDVDNVANGASAQTREQIKTSMKEQRVNASSEGTPMHKGELLFNALTAVFNSVSNNRYWKKAFEVHQPLRQMFWDAFGGVEPVSGTPKAEALKKFWETCAAVTNKPREMTLPVWQMKKDEEGRMRFDRQELHVPHLVLYRSWTMDEADKIVQPIKQAKGLRDMVQAAHIKTMEQFDEKFDKWLKEVDKPLGQRLASLGRRIWRDIRAPR